jgi:hypothetical protein
VVSKGEYTYGWYSASEGKCKATKDRLRFSVVTILMLVKFYLTNTYLLEVSSYQPT